MEFYDTQCFVFPQQSPQVQVEWLTELKRVLYLLLLMLKTWPLCWTESSVQFSRSVVSSSLRPHGLQHSGFPVHHQLPELAQIHVHWVGDTIHPSHPLNLQELNLGAWVLGQVEKNSFIALPSQGGYSWPPFSNTVCPNPGGFGEGFIGPILRWGCWLD